MELSKINFHKNRLIRSCVLVSLPVIALALVIAIGLAEAQSAPTPLFPQSEAPTATTIPPTATPSAPSPDQETPIPPPPEPTATMRPPPPDPTATPYPTPTLEPSPPAWPNYPPPVSGQFNPSPGPLGNPTELTATAGNYAPGHVSLQWKPAANGSVHWAYVVKVDGSDGGYWEEFRTYNGRFYSPEYLSLNFVLPEIGQEY